jgi:ATP-dependent RNA helicase RhlB
MNEPTEVHIASENITVDTIDQQVYHVGSSQKIELLLGLLKRYAVSRVLIFVNMKHIAEELAERLTGNGFNADYLTGDLPQSQRLRRINMFKNNELPILIATDVAARGIHVDDLELVVNYDIPMHCENYVHRIGRTARAGKSGRAITLACETFVEFLAPIEKFIQMKIPSVVAEDELYLPDVTAGKHYRRQRRSSGSDRFRERSGSAQQRPGNRNYSSGRSDNRERGEHRGNNEKGERSYSGRTGRTDRTGNNSSGSDRQKRYSTGNRKEQYPGEQSVNPQRQTANRQQNPNRPQRKTEEGRIPASHSHDGRIFEKHQHPSGTVPHRKDAPEKKKGLFAKVMSMFR